MIEKTEREYKPKIEELKNYIHVPLPVVPTLESLLRNVSCRDMKMKKQVRIDRDKLHNYREKLISSVKEERTKLESQGCWTTFRILPEAVELDYTYLLEA